MRRVTFATAWLSKIVDEPVNVENVELGVVGQFLHLPEGGFSFCT